jgi:hypothetical protein
MPSSSVEVRAPVFVNYGDCLRRIGVGHPCEFKDRSSCVGVKCVTKAPRVLGPAADKAIKFLGPRSYIQKKVRDDAPISTGILLLISANYR